MPTTYTNAQLRTILAETNSLPVLAYGSIEDPQIKALARRVYLAWRKRYDAQKAVEAVLGRPDVRPNTAEVWCSNTRLRSKISQEGGLEYTLFAYGIDPADIEDKVVAVAWRKARAAGNRMDAAYAKVKKAVRATKD